MFAIFHPGFQVYFVKNTILNNAGKSMKAGKKASASMQGILGHIHTHVMP